MKELEKVKRISIASTLFILAVLIGLLTFKRPKNMYAISTKTTLENLTSKTYLISTDEISYTGMVLIDMRSPYEYDKGHLENAINMPSAEILSDENQSKFQEYMNSNLTVVLYGNSPEEANIPFAILEQLGFDNVKVLAANIGYFQNKLITTKSEIEKPVADIKGFLEESAKNSNSSVKEQDEVQEPTVKKVIPVQKKKKKPVEGGC